MIVGYRWSETDEEYEFHVRAGGHRHWKFEDAIAPHVVDAFKASKPDIWTRYACEHCGCSQFAESGCEEDLEGWVRCSCCTFTLCPGCDETGFNIWSCCAVDECRSVYCSQHARRITTSNHARNDWFCCKPWMIQREFSGEPPERDGWGVPLPPQDFSNWEANGWLDEDHPDGLRLEQFWPTRPPSGYEIVSEAPPAAWLTPGSEHHNLEGRKVMYRWPYTEDPDFTGGWCVGVVESAVAVAGRVEFEVSYECDKTTATTQLTLDNYGCGDVEDAWMLLRPEAEAAALRAQLSTHSAASGDLATVERTGVSTSGRDSI